MSGNEAKEVVSFVYVMLKNVGYINEIQLAKFGLFIDRSIFLKVRWVQFVRIKCDDDLLKYMFTKLDKYMSSIGNSNIPMTSFSVID